MSAILGIVARAIALLPWRALTPLGAALGFLVGTVARVRRSTVDRALACAGVAVAHPTASGAAVEMYRGLGRGLLELFWLAGASDARAFAAVDAHVSLEGPAEAALVSALESGPVVLFASHTGNWELAMFAAARFLARRGRRLAVVAKPIHARAVNDFTTRLRERMGVRLIAPHGAITATCQALSAGDVVAMPIDQVPDRNVHGDRVPFLGAPALVDRGPAVVAARAHATVLVVAAARRSAGRHELHVLATLEALEGRSREPIRRVSQRATAALETFVRREPGQWLWLHRRWRDARKRWRDARDRPAGARPDTLVARGHTG